MANSTQRPASLKAIVAYKGLVVLTLATISLLSAFSLNHYDRLVQLAQDYLVDGELSLSGWFLRTILHLQPQGLRLVSEVAGLYAIVMGVATVGLWYGKKWANVLMLLMAGLPLPLEIQRLVHHLDWNHGLILILNIMVVAYLLKHVIAPGEASTIQLENLEESV